MVMGEMTQKTEVLVIGGGPGGYAAAFRAADLGMDVTLVDTRPAPGGVCLYDGCIPSKTLLFLSGLIFDARRAEKMGVHLGPPRIELEALQKWKDKVVDKLAKGLAGLCEKRNVQWIRGRAVFEGADRVRLHDSDIAHLQFRHAIVSVGSSPLPLPDVEFDSGGRVMDSSRALQIPEIPETLLVVGGEYIALELAQIYAALGSKVTLVVRGDRMLRYVDRDLVKPLARQMKKLCEKVRFNTELESVRERENEVEVTLKDEKGQNKETFHRVLAAVGRIPNTRDLGLENTNVKVDDRGYIEVDETQKTAQERIFAVGDVVKGPMLAHKAIRQGKVAAEVIAGQPSAFDARAVPGVVYTDPEVAWCGLTEEEAKKQDIPVKTARFPWGASGRATTMGISDGLTKLIIQAETGRILGAGIVGRDAEALIAESVLAVEMGALAEDLALSIHPHPSLTETEEEAAEIFLGSATHLLKG